MGPSPNVPTQSRRLSMVSHVQQRKEGTVPSSSKELGPQRWGCTFRSHDGIFAGAKESLQSGAFIGQKSRWIPLVND